MEEIVPYNRRAIDPKYGAPVVRSGQRIGDSFTDSIVSSYANLINAPLVFTLYSVSMILCLAEYLEADQGPLEVVENGLLTTEKSKNNNKIIKILLSVAISFTRFLIYNKNWIFNAFLMLIPYLRKPSSKNLYISLLAVLCSFLFRFETISVLLFSQGWFLITELRNPRHKMIVAVLGVILIALSWVELDTYAFKNQNSYSSSSGRRVTDKPAPTPPTLLTEAHRAKTNAP